MAFGNMRCNPYFCAYYDKNRVDEFTHEKPMTALMNTLLKTLYGPLSKQQMFIAPE